MLNLEDIFLSHSCLASHWCKCTPSYFISMDVCFVDLDQEIVLQYNLCLYNHNEHA